MENPTVPFGLTLADRGIRTSWPGRADRRLRYRGRARITCDALGGEIITAAPVESIDEFGPVRPILLDLMLRSGPSQPGSAGADQTDNGWTCRVIWECANWYAVQPQVGRTLRPLLAWRSFRSSI